MRKKGFTLVELLAVIVIIGIILVMAVPSVRDALFNTKKKAYKANVENLYSTVKSQYRLDKADGKTHRTTVYCENNDGSCSSDSISLGYQSSTGISYLIYLDVNGEVLNMTTTDGRFLYNCFSIDECKTVDYILDIE